MQILAPSRHDHRKGSRTAPTILPCITMLRSFRRGDNVTPSGAVGGRSLAGRAVVQETEAEKFYRWKRRRAAPRQAQLYVRARARGQPGIYFHVAIVVPSAAHSMALS